MLVSMISAAVIALLLVLCRDIYFHANGVTDEIYELACIYYRLTPINTALSEMTSYLTQSINVCGGDRADDHREKRKANPASRIITSF